MNILFKKHHLCFKTVTKISGLALNHQQVFNLEGIGSHLNKIVLFIAAFLNSYNHKILNVS